MDADWLTYQDGPQQKGYVLTQLARKNAVDLHVVWISGASNFADAYTTASGYQKWSQFEGLASLATAV